MGTRTRYYYNNNYSVTLRAFQHLEKYNDTINFLE
jgi:hypothetical protein